MVEAFTDFPGITGKGGSQKQGVVTFQLKKISVKFLTAITDPLA